MSYIIYNSHIHTFKEDDIPRRFLPLGLVRILASRFGSNVFTRFLNNLNPLSDHDTLDRYVKFIEIGKKTSQQAIFENCKRFYPDLTKFVILPMDMAYMGAGPVPRPYEEQLDELVYLKSIYPDLIIPFIHIDPRRPNYKDLFFKYVEEHQFQGLKLYPPLGVFPYDERLYPIYEYCEKNQLPVIAHCSPYNPVHYKGSKKELLKLLSLSKTTINTKKKSKKDLCSNFSHPHNYKYIMKDFPKLKISMAHFGSGYYWKEYMEDPGNPENWFSIIRKMIFEYDHFYTDISFTMNDTSYFALLKILMEDESVFEKILFGSDYYMVQTKTDERRFGLELRAYLGEKLFRQMAHTNPEHFLCKPSINIR